MMGTTGKIPEKQLLQGAYDDPEKLVIAGLDPLPPGIDPAKIEPFIDDDESHEPPDPGLVDSILAHGVNDPITVISVRSSSDGRPTYRIVVNGRQRVMAARIANVWLRKDKSDYFVRVPYTVKADANAITVGISNEFRKRRSILSRARRAAKLLKWGTSKEDVIKSFASDDGKTISRQTLDNWLKLLKLPAEAQAKIESGELSPTAGYALADAPPEATAAALASPTPVTAKQAQATAKAANGTHATSEAKAKAARTATNPKPSARALAALANKYVPSETEPFEHDWEAPVGALLEWIVTGDATGLSDWPSLREQCERVMRPAHVGIGKEVL